MKKVLLFGLLFSQLSLGYTAKDAQTDAKGIGIKAETERDALKCEKHILNKIKKKALEGSYHLHFDTDVFTPCCWGNVPESVVVRLKEKGFLVNVMDVGINDVGWTRIITVGW